MQKEREGTPGSRNTKREGIGSEPQALLVAGVSSLDGEVPRAHGAPWEDPEHPAELCEMEFALYQSSSSEVKTVSGCLRVRAGTWKSALSAYRWPNVPLLSKDPGLVSPHQRSRVTAALELDTFSPSCSKTSVAHQLFQAPTRRPLITNCCDIYHYNSGMGSI